MSGRPLKPGFELSGEVAHICAHLTMVSVIRAPRCSNSDDCPTSPPISPDAPVRLAESYLSELCKGTSASVA